MFTKQQPTMARRALRFAALFVVAGGLSWISVSGETLGKVFDRAPAEVGQAHADTRPVSAASVMRPWSEFLSEQAVDAKGIENDLDGNASALVASPLP